MTNDQTTININMADPDALAQLPGVGPKMAQRIINERPFASVDDLQRVNGVSAAVLERWRPLVVVLDTAASEEAVPEAPSLPHDELGLLEESAQPEEADQLEEEASLAFEGEPSPSERMHPPSLEPQLEEQTTLLTEEARLEEESPSVVREVSPEEPARPSRLYSLFVALGKGLVVAGLAVVLSLGILSNLNGGTLEFVTTSQLRELRREMDGLGTRIDTVAQDEAGLRTRLDNLEALSRNVSAIEASVAQLQSDLDAAVVNAETLAAQIEDLSTQIRTLGPQMENVSATVQSLQSSNERFQVFLEGLGSLLNEVHQLEEGK